MNAPACHARTEEDVQILREVMNVNVLTPMMVSTVKNVSRIGTPNLQILKDVIYCFFSQSTENVQIISNSTHKLPRSGLKKESSTHRTLKWDTFD